MAKRRKAAFRFKLPDPKKTVLKHRVERCEGCKEPLEIGKGYGFCLSCHETTPLPIGVVASKGPYHGKYVYLQSAFERELSEDTDDYTEELDEELRNKDYIIIKEID